MKKLVLILLLLFSLKSIAQEQVLLDNVWYFEEGILNDVIFYPSPNFTGILDVSNEGVAVLHSYCEEDMLSDLTILNNQFFNIENLAVPLLGTCSEPIDLDFIDKHYTFYGDYIDGMFANNPFTYNIEQINDYLQLTITNGLGDIAVYNSILLNVSSLNVPSFNIYPNPVQNTLNIQTPAQLYALTIYNLQGQEVFYKEKATKTIDVSFLNTGMYFVKLETQEGNVVKKVVKQ